MSMFQLGTSSLLGIAWWILLVGVLIFIIVYACFAMAVLAGKKHAAIPTLNKSQFPSFPLGDLGAWRDLLALNKEILASGHRVIIQWTFYKQSGAFLTHVLPCILRCSLTIICRQSRSGNSGRQSIETNIPSVNFPAAPTRVLANDWYAPYQTFLRRPVGWCD